jgi:hypothetical protein
MPQALAALALASGARMLKFDRSGQLVSNTAKFAMDFSQSV